MQRAIPYSAAAAAELADQRRKLDAIAVALPVARGNLAAAQQRLTQLCAIRTIANSACESSSRLDYDLFKVVIAAGDFYSIILAQYDVVRGEDAAATNRLRELEHERAATNAEVTRLHAAAQRVGLYSLPVELLEMLIGFKQRGVCRMFARHMMRRPKHHIAMRWPIMRADMAKRCLMENPGTWIIAESDNLPEHKHAICAWSESTMNNIVASGVTPQTYAGTRYNNIGQFLQGVKDVQCPSAAYLALLLRHFGMPNLRSVWVGARGAVCGPQVTYSGAVSMGAWTLLHTLPSIVWDNVVTVTNIDGNPHKFAECYAQLVLNYGQRIYRPRVHLGVGCDPANFRWADLV